MTWQFRVFRGKACQNGSRAEFERVLATRGSQRLRRAGDCGDQPGRRIRSGPRLVRGYRGGAFVVEPAGCSAQPAETLRGGGNGCADDDCDGVGQEVRPPRATSDEILQHFEESGAQDSAGDMDDEIRTPEGEPRRPRRRQRSAKSGDEAKEKEAEDLRATGDLEPLRI